jgi:hypothetical protein
MALHRGFPASSHRYPRPNQALVAGGRSCARDLHGEGEAAIGVATALENEGMARQRFYGDIVNQVDPFYLATRGVLGGMV